jgi:hypothetical protein
MDDLSDRPDYYSPQPPRKSGSGVVRKKFPTATARTRKEGMMTTSRTDKTASETSLSMANTNARTSRKPRTSPRHGSQINAYELGET